MRVCILALLGALATAQINYCPYATDQTQCTSQTAFGLYGCLWSGSSCYCPSGTCSEPVIGPPTPGSPTTFGPPTPFGSPPTPGGGSPALSPAQKEAKQKTEVRAYMRAAWIPIVGVLSGGAMMALAFSSGGKADGQGFLLQIAAGCNFVLAAALLINLEWVLGLWLMCCSPFIIAAAGKNNKTLLFLVSIMLFWNVISMTGWLKDVTIIPNMMQTGQNFIERINGQAETSCQNYYPFYDTATVVTEQQNYELCAKNGFVGFLVFDAVILYCLQPLMGFLSFTLTLTAGK